MYDNYYNNQPPLYRQRLSMQQAQEIALQRVPGQVLHVDMDMEHGVLVYEFFILTNQNRIYEVEINAKTGRIMIVEEEVLD
ncbi:PepSY domain-containing protein [Bacillus sp. SD075]|uniref:PepSY domain-containing protein n=1 Tax=Bacillus sp. SD075 TaxID=2781732 RepID=UPI0037C077DA